MSRDFLRKFLLNEMLAIWQYMNVVLGYFQIVKDFTGLIFPSENIVLFTPNDHDGYVQ